MKSIQQDIYQLSQQQVYLFFSYQNAYWDPLLSQHQDTLDTTEFLKQSITQRIIWTLNRHLEHIDRGIYFPVPIARDSVLVDDLLESIRRYHTPFIYVNADQEWRWKGLEVVGKTKELFLSHLSYEREIERYVVEYRTEQRLDRCYLECETTPIKILRFIPNAVGIQVELNTGHFDTLLLSQVYIDQKERVFCHTQTMGLAKCSDATRFELLQGLLPGQGITFHAHRLDVVFHSPWHDTI